MAKYKCGHEIGGIIILDDNELSMIAYLDWSETIGLRGEKSKCWNCYCKESA